MRLIAALATLGLLALAGCGDTSGPSYSATISVQMQHNQQVGVPVTLTASLHNTGSAMQNLVMGFGGLSGNYQVDDFSSDSGSPNRLASDTWAFGPLAAGATINVKLTITPTAAGNPVIYTDAYANEDSSSGLGDTNEEVSGDEVSVSAYVQ